jgi:predicted TIM-barrel fold metal-dependent hydrolase
MAFARESPMAAAVDRYDIARGVSQIVLGTDYPNIPYDYDGDLRGLRDRGVPEAMIRRITSENARRLGPAFR